MFFRFMSCRFMVHGRSDGASIVEYALLAALIGLALAVVVGSLSEPLGTIFNRASEGLELD